MVLNLIVGSIIVSLAIATAAIFIGIAVRVLERVSPWLALPPHGFKTTVTLICASLWLLAAITVVSWMWAAAFMRLGLFDGLEPALYFSTATLTTLGYGDIILPPGWRLLSGICAANGLLLFGLCAAFLFELFFRLNEAQSKYRSKT